MSTASEIERMPASRSRDAIHGGVGRVASIPRTTRVAKAEQPTRPRIGASSAIVTGKVSLGAVMATASTGSRNCAPVACEYSRATPRIENA